MTRSHADAPKSSRTSRTLLLATDNKNSILAEIDGGKLNPVAYSAYGQQSAQEGVATGLGFNGALRERQVGWYLLGNGYRAYNPTLMRFHSPDSWSPFGGGGLNAYMYCVGDPVNFSDPTGHMPKGIFSRFRKSLTVPDTNLRTASIQSPSSSTSTLIGTNATPVPATTPTHVMVVLPQPNTPTHVMVRLPRATADAQPSPVSRRDIDVAYRQSVTGQQNGQSLSSSPPQEGMMPFQQWIERHHRPREHAPVSLPTVRSSNNDPTSGHTLVMGQNGQLRISLNRPAAETLGGMPNPPTVHPDGQTIGLRLRLNSPVEASTTVRRK